MMSPGFLVDRFSNTLTMPPKRQKQVTPPPNGKKRKVQAKGAQSSIDAFFTSPSKPKVNGIKREHSVISIGDSDDDNGAISTKKQANGGKEESDEAMAKRLATEWASVPELKSPLKNKGKGRAPSVDEESEDGIVPLDAPSPPAQGVNGSSSSALRLSPSRPVPAPPKTAKPVEPNVETKPDTKVHPMFAKRPATPPKSTPLADDVKPIITPTKGGTITSTTAEPVEALNFDTDAFLFRPEDVDTSKWPKGRLPYSILVGVYVQVSSTRSRLLIVRVLTK